MAKTLLPYQCNYVEGLWKNTNKKNNTKTKREKVEMDKRKRRRKRRKNKKKKKKEKQQQRMKRDRRLVWVTCYFKYLVQPLLSRLLLPYLSLFFSYQFFGSRSEKSPKLSDISWKSTMSLKGAEFKACFSVFFLFLGSDSKGSREPWEAI